MDDVLGLSVDSLAARVGLAALLGGAIGLEREIDDKEAGLRTHIVLALGAAMFGMISVSAFEPFVTGGGSNLTIDVSRVASYVPAGVGFIGAGTILKEHGTVRGLTTAASIWLTAAVGLAAGLEFYGPAVAVTVAAIAALTVLRFARALIQRHVARNEQVAFFELESDVDLAPVFDKLRNMDDVHVRSLDVTASGAATKTLRVELRAGPSNDLPATLVAFADATDGILGLALADT